MHKMISILVHETHMIDLSSLNPSKEARPNANYPKEKNKLSPGFCCYCGSLCENERKTKDKLIFGSCQRAERT